MLTSRARAEARPPLPNAVNQRRLPPLTTLCIILLIAVSLGLGLIMLVLKLWMPALIFLSLAAGLTQGRQLSEQSRQANTRFEEMTRELRLIRLGLASGALSAERVGSDSPVE